MLRAADGAAKAASAATFAAGLDRPFGIAFYPPGPDPHFVYVAETDAVVRFPYRAGETKAAGPAEIVVPSLPAGRGHWTRDLAFSPDGKTMFVSVGSASNIAEDMPDAPAEGLAAFAADARARRRLGRRGEPRRRARLRSRRRRACASSPPASATAPAWRSSRQTGALWCAVNERDGLGDDLPPDYVTRVKPGAFYGWPWFYIGDHRGPAPRGASAPISPGT